MVGGRGGSRVEWSGDEEWEVHGGVPLDMGPLRDKLGKYVLRHSNSITFHSD